MEKRFGVTVAGQPDKTSVKPYKIFVKLFLSDEEFKKRIKNVLKVEGKCLLIEENKDFLQQKLLKKPIFIVKMVNYNDFLMKYAPYERNYLFPIEPSKDLSISDVKGISFVDKEDSEFVRDNIEKVLVEYLQEQERIYLSI